MNINITISSDSSESRSIHLLTEVVECLQLEKIELNEKYLSLNSKKNNVEIQLAEQVEKCQLLEAEKKELEEKLAEQQGKYQTLEAEKKDFESKLTEQEGICQKLETENKELEEKLAEQQGKYQTLEAEKKDFEGKLTEQEGMCQKLEAEKKELEEKFAEQQGKYQTLEAEKKDFEGKLTEQEGMCQKLETENKELEEKFAEQQGKYQTLEAEKKDIESKLTEQEGICQKLDADKVSVESSYAELQKQQDEAQTRRLIEAIKSLSQMLQYSLGTSLSPKWLEYLGGIKSDIDKFITEEQTISDITLKIVSKNGWLAKLTSIRWWSKAISVKNDLPTSLQDGSGFHVSFCNLQHLLKENGVDILIPTCDFSSNIDNYKVDYDEVTIIKDLFPAYIPKSYVLCEINYVSFNGNMGKCIGYKS